MLTPRPYLFIFVVSIFFLVVLCHLVALKFSNSFKQHIRRLWAQAFIGKVYGHSFGFNYIQNRLLSLWKPTGKLDCMDLGYGFFLTRFSLQKDYETILKKGPWFMGEHFLSIRP